LKGQAAAVEFSTRQQSDLLVVLGTGGGKSLIFMIAGMNQVEINGDIITVVVVPLKALLDDLTK